MYSRCGVAFCKLVVMAQWKENTATLLHAKPPRLCVKIWLNVEKASRRDPSHKKTQPNRECRIHLSVHLVSSFATQHFYHHRQGHNSLPKAIKGISNAMAQLPPYLVRIVASMLTQALTRKLANSPLFFRIVDRMIHEIDHMPHRMQGRQVPTYQPPLGMRESEWDQDQGEPHNEPSPFPESSKGKQAGSTSTGVGSTRQPTSFEEAQRQRARMSYQQSQRLAQRDRERAQAQQKSTKDDSVSKELKELQDKLRELRNSKPGNS